MSRAIIMAGWDDVPHLDDAERKRLLEATPPHLRDARSRGIPSLGAGAIYPIALEDILCDPFTLPASWPMGYGMDVGWKATAAVWGAWDRTTDIVYLWREYKRGQAEPAVHVSAIQAAGKGLCGAIDPASRGRSQTDGSQLLRSYQELGLNLVSAKNAVEDGLFGVYQRFTTGRLKIFRPLVQTVAELRLYRRDEHGKVVKENDHLMDAIRYLIATLETVMTWVVSPDESSGRGTRGEQAWMAS